MNVWATACPYCRHELFDLTNFHNAHHQKNAVVLGLTLDFPSFDYPDRAYLADFTASNFIDYPLLLVNGEVASEVIGQAAPMCPLPRCLDNITCFCRSVSAAFFCSEVLS